MKMNKGQKLQKYEALSYGSCTLHFFSMRSIYLKFHVDALRSFKVMLQTKKGRIDGRGDYYMPPFKSIKEVTPILIACYKSKGTYFEGVYFNCETLLLGFQEII